jgi:hypothetical protein
MAGRVEDWFVGLHSSDGVPFDGFPRRRVSFVFFPFWFVSTHGSVHFFVYLGASKRTVDVSVSKRFSVRERFFFSTSPVDGDRPARSGVKRSRSPSPTGISPSLQAPSFSLEPHNKKPGNLKKPCVYLSGVSELGKFTWNESIILVCPLCKNFKTPVFFLNSYFSFG